MNKKDAVLKLREETGWGMLDCKNAYEQFDEDYDKALAYLTIKERSPWVMYDYVR
ncbi:hypothetical protein AAXB25_15050 [Paenibacillus lautus]|uniref:hypothetical protein n=1 Tax=Paenibacillus lautus TaxID=1401 RepID=UPI003D2783C4